MLSNPIIPTLVKKKKSTTYLSIAPLMDNCVVLTFPLLLIMLS